MKEKILKLRESTGLTQKDFGAMIGVSGKVVSKWERGINAPDISKLKTISEVFFVGIEELVGSPRLENVAFPPRKIEKGFLYYIAFALASLFYIAASIAFCVYYVGALNGQIDSVKPVGDVTVGFMPVVFGVILAGVFVACSQIKFRAYSVFMGKYLNGKTLNEYLLLPYSIRKVYAVLGKWLGECYFVLQVWNSFNIVAYGFIANAVLRYSSHFVCIIFLVAVTLHAGYALKRIAAKDKAAAEVFEDNRC